ncbi:ROK family protein [Sunxiuqinia sp. A32]|uniref:ROK family protein n=1 Tax=Sunxiuqinia sp. A32 TaxID=3461496 RepID=UPI0040461118
MATKFAIGVDVGGSHVSCAAFDLNEKKYLENTFSETDLDNHAEADVVIASWGKPISETIEKIGKDNVVGIGFAMPGPFDYEKGIPLFTGENNKYENIYGLNVPEKLRQFLDLPADFPVRFINDATAFAIGEEWIGKASGSKASLSITLGTGFGSAFIKESLPVASGDTVPDQGCVWHLPFETGIADDYFSTRGVVNRYNEKTGNSVTGAKDVAMAAETEDAAKEVFIDFGIKLVDLLKEWFHKFDVETLVIGGNISRAYDLFWPSMKSALEKEGLNVNVEISELKETASIIGSARLIESSYWVKVNSLLKDM